MLMCVSWASCLLKFGGLHYGQGKVRIPDAEYADVLMLEPDSAFKHKQAPLRASQAVNQ